MFGLTPDDARQLKLFGWFLLITNGLIVGMGLLFGRALEERSGAVALMLSATKTSSAKASWRVILIRIFSSLPSTMGRWMCSW